MPLNRAVSIDAYWCMSDQVLGMLTRGTGAVFWQGTDLPSSTRLFVLI